MLFPSHSEFRLVAVLEVLCVKDVDVLYWFEGVVIGHMVDVKKPRLVQISFLKEAESLLG